jgi:hypothetical protein
MVGGAGVCHPVSHGRGGANAIELRQPMRDCGSHSPNHDAEGGDCCDRGDVNEGPTWCIRKPHWGAIKKVCGGDQYRALSMDGSKEDGQAGCTGKPYWGVVKKAYGVDQSSAPSMDGSKDGQAGAPPAVPVEAPATAAVVQGPAAPAAVPAGAPTVAAASKGLATPVTRPARALAPAARKRRLAGG